MYSPPLRNQNVKPQTRDRPLNRCYLGLGSNQKCPERQIRQAVKRLKNLPLTTISKVSKPYWNQAWGLAKQQQFCNVVMEIHTILPPYSLLKFCNAIEQKQGRVRKKKHGPRTLDVDILLYGNRVIQTKQLIIPHPHMKVRNFVLIPLFEINPGISLDLEK